MCGPLRNSVRSAATWGYQSNVGLAKGAIDTLCTRARCARGEHLRPRYVLPPPPRSPNLTLTFQQSVGPAFLLSVSYVLSLACDGFRGSTRSDVALVVPAVRVVLRRTIDVHRSYGRVSIRSGACLGGMSPVPRGFASRRMLFNPAHQMGELSGSLVG